MDLLSTLLFCLVILVRITLDIDIIWPSTTSLTQRRHVTHVPNDEMLDCLSFLSFFIYINIYIYIYFFFFLGSKIWGVFYEEQKQYHVKFSSASSSFIVNQLLIGDFVNHWFFLKLQKNPICHFQQAVEIR